MHTYVHVKTIKIKFFSMGVRYITASDKSCKGHYTEIKETDFLNYLLH